MFKPKQNIINAQIQEENLDDIIHNEQSINTPITQENQISKFQNEIFNEKIKKEYIYYKPIDKIQETDNLDNIFIQPVEDTTINKINDQISNNLSVNDVENFEGASIQDLQKIGFKTTNSIKLASDKALQKYDLDLLEKIPLDVIFEYEKITLENGSYNWLGKLISIKDDKWYNKTDRIGSVKAISLVKHLIAIKEDVNEYDNNKQLFKSACAKLQQIQNDIQNNNIKSNKLKLEPKKIDWKALTEQLNNVPLIDVVNMLGARKKKNNIWEINATGHNIKLDQYNNRWKNWNGSGGHGAISLLSEQLSYINNFSLYDEQERKKAWKLAINTLIQEFGDDYQAIIMGESNFDYKVPFVMPRIIDFKLNDVAYYLNQKRGIPKWIISKQILTGNLFAGFPADWKENPYLKNPEKLTNDFVWATFLSPHGNAAEMRALDRSDDFSKILATGSDKDLGGFLIKAEPDCNEKIVANLEAAIDSMSYHAFYPGRIAMSSMGVNFNLAVKTAIEALDGGYKYSLAFDNDLAGNQATVSFKKQFINDVDETTYNQLIDEGKIKLFDLGIKVLKETIKNGGIYYFDNVEGEIGMEAVKMFQEQLRKDIGNEQANEWIKQGKIKYINLEPIWPAIKDPYLEAQRVINLLSTGKPYYLRDIAKDDDDDLITENRIAFQNAMNELAGNKIDQWLKDGLIITKKNSIAKDWNEFFIYMSKKPDFKEHIKEQENKYLSYREEQEDKPKQKMKL